MGADGSDGSGSQSGQLRTRLEYRDGRFSVVLRECPSFLARENYRGKQEMAFASEFAGEITSARSVPDVMNAYQNWISKRMALYMEDGQRVLNTTMKLLSIGKESNNT